MRYVLVVILSVLASLNALAQWDQYVPPCEHRGNQDLWQIIGYKEGLASWEKAVPDKGSIRWSDSCVEIDCDNMQMYFEVKKYEKVGPNYFKVYRKEYDELYDYMEVRQGFGINKNKYMILMGRLDDDGNMQNTIVIICRPMQMKAKNIFRPNVGGMR